jgi:hypothetical protein
MHFVFAAMARAGVFEKYTVPEMHRWKIHPDTGTFTEMWTRGDYSHGWGGTPLIQMSSLILGVTPSAPGYRTVAIRPLLSGLDWARGTVPTPHGLVDVAWERSGPRLSLRVTIPPGAEGEVYLPLGAFTKPTVMLDGTAIPLPAPDGRTVLQSGVHTFRIGDAR